jgi:hypothetical protein
MTEPTTVGCFPDRVLSLGRWDGVGRVFLEADLLRQLAGKRADTPDWEEKFVQMVNYAEGSGWLDPDRRIKVHVEYDASM